MCPASSLRLVVCLGVCLGAYGLAGASLIPMYQNDTPTTGYQSPDGFFPFTDDTGRSDPFGDQVHISASCVAAEFDLQLSSDKPLTLANLSLTFYNDDGWDGNHDYDAAPGTQIWTTSVSNVAVNGLTVVPFYPNVTVPKDFTWIVQSVSPDAGLATCNPPMVGSSGDWYWVYDTVALGWYARIS